jgi:hypothetical protein
MMMQEASATVVQPAAPVQPAQPPQRTVTVYSDGRFIARAGGPQDAAAVYRAAEAKRDVLGDQMNRLTERREELANRLRTRAEEGTDKAGLEKQISELDLRISDLEKQIAQADQEVAQAAGIPGAIVPDPPPPPRTGPPEEFFVLSGIFIVVVLMPVAVGYARRLWKRAAMVVAPVPRELMERFARIEQAVDAIAMEVERQGEGQRFLTKLFSENGARALGQGAAQPVEVGAKPSASRIPSPSDT